MHYIAVEWIHDFPDDPISLYYELDDDRYEHRKVEKYRDGTMHSADATHGEGSTFLAWEPHPTPQEIAADPQFQLSEIPAQEFERIWYLATSGRMQSAVASR